MKKILVVLVCLLLTGCFTVPDLVNGGEVKVIKYGLENNG